MGFIKEVLKKLLIAAITGALILAFVYYKDHYLEQGNSDMEMLQSVQVEKQEESTPVAVQEQQTNEINQVQEKVVVEQEPVQQEEPPLVIEVEKPQESIPVIAQEVESQPQEIIEPQQQQVQEIVEQKSIKTTEPTVEKDSFEEFKSSMDYGSKKSAFDELDRETN